MQSFSMHIMHFSGNMYNDVTLLKTAGSYLFCIGLISSTGVFTV